ncbi:MAG: acyl--CoA ligase [Gammaproteobacteria bacterium]|nr:acyl--CoA ligase [Gammaproteobacteria bacterium]
MRTTPPELIAKFHAAGWWGNATLYDLFAANTARVPERLAVIDPPNRPELVGGAPLRLSYAALDARVRRLAARLLREGLTRGDIVIAQLPNIAEYVILYLAAARIGLVLSPVPMQYRGHELGHIIALTRPAAFVTVASFRGSDYAALARQAMQGHGPVLLLGGGAAPGAITLADDDGSGAELDAAAPPAADDSFTICWTSGTEGVPKGVPRSHNHWVAIGWAHFDGAQLRDGDRLLNPFPLVNMGAIGGCFLSWLRAAGTLILHHPLDLAVYLRQIANERADYAIAPPAVLNMLLQNDALLDSADLSSLRCIGSGSAPLAAWMIEGYRARFGIDVVNIFGSNEGVSLISGPIEIPDPALRARYFPRFGRPEVRWPARTAAMIETRLLDPDSGVEILTAGPPGELQIRGPGVFDGYFRSPELTARAFTADHWFRTGDLFRIAGEPGDLRYYEFVGRARQQIVRGGFKISPEELDELLAGHPDIAEAAVIGIPDRVLGERVCAMVVPRPGRNVTLDDLRHYFEERGVAVFKWPERVRILTQLPRNPMGKVVREELSRFAAAG